MASNLLPASIIESKVKQTASLIFLHGLGDTGHGWAETLREYVPPYCKVICPHAKARPVALNMNMVMPAWHDIYGLDFDAPQDENGIKSAAEELSKWVDAEVTAGIPANRIIVGGFSQGGSVSLYYALTNKKNPITGVVALSCWLPLHARFMQNPNLVEADKSLPIFQCHGTMDPIVPFEMGSETSTILKNMGFSKSSLTKIPGMGHSSSDRELEMVREFFNEKLPAM
uniref:palmitoyl-protein hydrolase n=1 Tax=Schistocephalus solidus TaxID=70667 RepID=A0A0X3PRN5_SCHSO